MENVQMTKEERRRAALLKASERNGLTVEQMEENIRRHCARLATDRERDRRLRAMKFAALQIVRNSYQKEN